MNAPSGSTVELLLTTILLLLMVVAAVGVVRVRNLFAVVLLGGVYSFLMATLMVALDAVDVGMTDLTRGSTRTRTRRIDSRRRQVVRNELPEVEDVDRVVAGGRVVFLPTVKVTIL